MVGQVAPEVYCKRSIFPQCEFRKFAWSTIRWQCSSNFPKKPAFTIYPQATVSIKKTYFVKVYNSFSSRSLLTIWTQKFLFHWNLNKFVLKVLWVEIRVPLFFYLTPLTCHCKKIVYAMYLLCKSPCLYCLKMLTCNKNKDKVITLKNYNLKTWISKVLQRTIGGLTKTFFVLNTF